MLEKNRPTKLPKPSTVSIWRLPARPHVECTRRAFSFSPRVTRRVSNSQSASWTYGWLTRQRGNLSALFPEKTLEIVRRPTHQSPRPTSAFKPPNVDSHVLPVGRWRVAEDLAAVGRTVLDHALGPPSPVFFERRGRLRVVRTSRRHTRDATGGRETRGQGPRERERERESTQN